MAIPSELHPEILSRHRAGQSDSAIVRWLSTLKPPVVVGRIAVLKLRQRLLSEAAEHVPEHVTRHKASGAQGRAARAAESKREQGQHAARGGGVVVIEIPPEANTERAHLHALAVQLRLQALVNADTVMTLPDKLRASCAIAQAMSKLSVQAELERRIECLERERAAEADILVAERQKVEIERRRVDAERAALNERWAQLRKELAGVQN